MGDGAKMMTGKKRWASYNIFHLWADSSVCVCMFSHMWCAENNAVKHLSTEVSHFIVIVLFINTWKIKIDTSN
jgi:hypothetical protein